MADLSSTVTCGSISRPSASRAASASPPAATPATPLTVLGFASFRFVTQETLKVVYLFELHLAEHLRRQSLGSQFLSTVDRYGRDAQRQGLLLTCHLANETATCKAGFSGAYCTQWPLQTVNQCRPQDICRDGGDATAHYGKDCKALGFTRSHHTQNLNFGGCGGTPEETEAQVFLYPGPKLEAKSEAFCSWVGNVDQGGAYCSQWPLQKIGAC